MRSVIIIVAVALASVAVRSQAPEADERLEIVRHLAGIAASARRAHIESQLEKSGIEFRRVEYVIPGGRGVNVEVAIGPEDGPAILLTAHHDVRKGSKGANNNASGCAVLLDVVKSLAASPPPRRVVAVFLDGGEMRLGGSRNWLEGRADERFLGAVNFEMCGRGDTVVLGPGEVEAGNRLARDARDAVAALPDAPAVRVMKTVPPSDHRSCLSAGLEVCALSMAPASQVEAIERRFHRRSGPLPAIYRDAYTGLDRAGKITSSALAIAVRAGVGIVRAIATRDDGGNPVVPGLRLRQRELGETLATATPRELVEVVEKLGHRGAVPELARLVDSGDEATSAAARKLLSRVLSGTELRSAVDPDGAGDAILEGYRRLSRRFTWNTTKKAFELQRDPAADR